MALHKLMSACVVSLQRLSPVRRQWVIAFLMYSNVCSTGLARTHRNSQSCTLINLIWWFLNVSTMCFTFLPAALLSVNFQSCIFHSCKFVRHFPVLHFPALHICPSFSSPAFSTPATLFVIFQSCIFQPCTFVRHFPVLQFPPPEISLSVIFLSCKFSAPALTAKLESENTDAGTSNKPFSSLYFAWM